MKKGNGTDSYKTILGFEPATFREPSPDWAMGAVSVPPEN